MKKICPHCFENDIGLKEIICMVCMELKQIKFQLKKNKEMYFFQNIKKHPNNYNKYKDNLTRNQQKQLLKEIGRWI